MWVHAAVYKGHLRKSAQKGSLATVSKNSNTTWCASISSAHLQSDCSYHDNVNVYVHQVHKWMCCMEELESDLTCRSLNADRLHYSPVVPLWLECRLQLDQRCQHVFKKAYMIWARIPKAGLSFDQLEACSQALAGQQIKTAFLPWEPKSRHQATPIHHQPQQHLAHQTRL